MAHPVLKKWESLSGLPAGKWLFSKLLGIMIPYTGSIGSKVAVLRPGYAEVHLRDRRKVRNHLRSVHAVSQLNLAEFCSGLAMTATLPENARAIVTHLEIEYHKKARGLLRATCSCPTEPPTEKETRVVIAEIHDQAGDVVSTTKATWLIDPRQPETRS